MYMSRNAWHSPTHREACANCANHYNGGSPQHHPAAAGDRLCIAEPILIDDLDMDLPDIDLGDFNGGITRTPVAYLMY